MGILGPVAVVLGLWGWVQVKERPALEGDIRKRAVQFLKQAGHEWVNIAIDGRDVILSGAAPHKGAALEAANLLYGVWGVKVVDQRASILPPVDPYLFQATRNGNTVDVAGFVETSDDRSRMWSSLRRVLPGMTVKGELKIGGGQPPGWMTASRFAAMQLRHLKFGQVKLTGRDVEITGQARDEDAFRALTWVLKNQMPPEYRLAQQSVNLALP